MSEQPSDLDSGPPTTCPHCGTDMVSGTVDMADTPDVTEQRDEPRAEFNPGEMVAVTYCPNEDCPGKADSQP